LLADLLNPHVRLPLAIQPIRIGNHPFPRLIIIQLLDARTRLMGIGNLNESSGLIGETTPNLHWAPHIAAPLIIVSDKKNPIFTIRIKSRVTKNIAQLVNYVALSLNVRLGQVPDLVPKHLFATTPFYQLIDIHLAT